MADYVFAPPPQNDEPPPSRKRRNTVAIVLGAIAAAILLLVIAIAAVGGSSTFALRGTMTIYSAEFSYGAECGTGGLADIYEGTAVTVYGPENKIVGVGRLANVGSTSPGVICSGDVIVPEVTDGLGFYSVEIAHRGKVTYTEQQMESGQVTLEM